MHDDRMIRGSAFDLEYLAYRGRIGGIGAESVDGFGWKYDQVARTQRFDGLFDVGL